MADTKLVRQQHVAFEFATAMTEVETAVALAAQAAIAVGNARHVEDEGQAVRHQVADRFGVEAGGLEGLLVEGPDNHHAAQVFTCHQIEPINQGLDDAELGQRHGQHGEDQRRADGAAFLVQRVLEQAQVGPLDPGDDLSAPDRLAVGDQPFEGDLRIDQGKDLAGHLESGQDKILLGDQFGTGAGSGRHRRGGGDVSGADIFFESIAQQSLDERGTHGQDSFKKSGLKRRP